MRCSRGTAADGAFSVREGVQSICSRHHRQASEAHRFRRPSRTACRIRCTEWPRRTLAHGLLRHGNVPSAYDGRSVLEPVAARYRYRAGKFTRYFRGDVGFAAPEVYEFLEKEGYLYAIRLPANEVLQREIAYLLTRPVGRPPQRPIIFYHSFAYRTASWSVSRRVVAKVEWHAGELFPRVGFIVTNLRRYEEDVVRFYNGRGTAEQWIKEGKNAVKWTRLSCYDFADNHVRL